MKIRTLLFLFWTLLLLAVLLSPMRQMNTGGFIYFDKVAHFCLFYVTGLASIYGVGFFSRFSCRLLFGLSFGTLLAIGTEFGQYFVPLRSPSLYDLMADMVGLLLGLISYTLLFVWKQNL